MRAIWQVIRPSLGKASCIGVSTLVLGSTSATVGAAGTSALTKQPTTLTANAATKTVAPQPAASAKATSRKVGATILLLTPKPALDSKVAQLQLPSLRPEQVHVESVNPALKPPVASAATGGTTLEVKQGQLLILNGALGAVPSALPTALAEKVKAPLPATLVVGVADPIKGTVARQFQPFLSAEVAPLRWDVKASNYATTVVVGLDPMPGEDDSVVTLSTAIRFQLSGENVASIEPPFLDIGVAGTTGYQRFRVLTGRFDQAVRVSAHSGFGDKSYEASVDPGPAQIEIGRSDARVDGFGLGKATIGVRKLAANKQEWPVLSVEQIQLETTGGFLSPASVLIPARGATAETTLVSTGWGGAIVSERNASGDSASRATVVFAFPWLKFLLGFLGAALAGALRVFSSAPGKRQGWGLVFIGCLASGVLIDILVALGAPLAPEWLLGMMRSELAWLAIGLVAGYPGVAAIAWLGEKLFAFKKPDKPEPASAGV